MNLQELKDIITRIESLNPRLNLSDVTVGVAVYRVGAIGGTPVVGVKSCLNGFDWDKNKFIIQSETELREIGRDEIKSIRDEYDKLGWDYYSKSRKGKLKIKDQ